MPDASGGAASQRVPLELRVRAGAPRAAHCGRCGRDVGLWYQARRCDRCLNWELAYLRLVNRPAA